MSNAVHLVLGISSVISSGVPGDIADRNGCGAGSSTIIKSNGYVMSQDINGYVCPRICRQSGFCDCSSGGEIAGVDGNSPIAESQAEAESAAGNVNNILKGNCCLPMRCPW